MVQRTGLCTSLLWAQLQFLLGELRSYKLHSVTKEKKDNVVCKYTHTELGSRSGLLNMTELP